MAKIRAKGRLIENVRSIVDNTRTHSVVLDWSPGMGGGDTGPNPLELSIMSLVGCAITIFADTAKNSKVELTKLEVSAEAEKSPDSPKLTSVNLKVKVQGKARKELLEALWRRTEANCPVFLVFQEPTPVKVELETMSE